MRTVVQRVTRASVEVNGSIVGSIGPGLMVLVGVTDTDTGEDAAWIASKLWNLRIFSDADGQMNLSCAEVGGEMLLISQFTLYGDARKGRRPSFVRASRGEHAEPLVDRVAAELRALGAQVETGIFGADMSVSLVNDGPVTIIVESPTK